MLNCFRHVLLLVLPPLLAAISHAKEPASAPMTHHPSREGLLKVASADATLHDARRHKSLPVHAAWPADATGPFPVIVFSHGAGGSGPGVATLTRFWAAHGYVCLNPTHADSITLRREAGEPATIFGLIKRVTSDPSAGIDRTRDVTLLLDSLDALEAAVPALKGKMDRGRIGMGGHSLGAFTAQLIGGAWIHVAGKAEMQSYADPRPRALLLLSPQGTGQQGLTRDSWTSITLPVLSATGSMDRGAQGQEPAWRNEPFEFSAPPGNKYHIWIEGAHHGSFAGRFAGGRLGPGVRLKGGGDQDAIFQWVQTATLNFWDAYLKDDAKAKAWLESDELEKMSGGKARGFRK